VILVMSRNRGLELEHSETLPTFRIDLSYNLSVLRALHGGDWPVSTAIGMLDIRWIEQTTWICACYRFQNLLLHAGPAFQSLRPYTSTAATIGTS